MNNHTESYADRRLRELGARPRESDTPARPRHSARDYSRAWRLTPEGARAHHAGKVRTRYGITLEAYDALLAGQEGRCAVCKATVTSAYAHVLVFGHTLQGAKRGTALIDVGATGNVRGLLCVRCRMGIGCFRGSAELLEAVTRYLRK